MPVNRRAQSAQECYEESAPGLDGRCKSELTAERMRAEGLEKELTVLAARYRVCQNEASQLRDDLQARNADVEAAVAAARQDRGQVQLERSSTLQVRHEFACMEEALGSVVRQNENAAASLRSQQDALREQAQRARKYEEDFKALHEERARDQQEHGQQIGRAHV